jgi:hypothetical protein
MGLLYEIAKTIRDGALHDVVSLLKPDMEEDTHDRSTSDQNVCGSDSLHPDGQTVKT